MPAFKLQSDYTPSGDQPQAIDQLTRGVNDGQRSQVLLGVTGSGKTFTMANLIQNTGKPTLVMAHNKTLAAQLYQELRDFFPQTPSITLSPIMITTSLKPTLPPLILTSKKRRLSMMKLTACA